MIGRVLAPIAVAAVMYAIGYLATQQHASAWVFLVYVTVTIKISEVSRWWE